MARPRKGTPEWDLWIAAIDIAADAPLRQGTYVTHARIPWVDIKRLRAALDTLGIDWRDVKRREAEMRRER